jgi:hypothetical protein
VACFDTDVDVLMVKELLGIRPWLALGGGGSGLGEGLYGGVFVVGDVEDGVETSDLHQVVDFIGEVEKLEFAALFAHGGKGADQVAQAGAVDVIDFAEVEQDFFVTFGQEASDNATKGGALFPEDDFASDVDDRDVAHLSNAGHHVHRFSLDFYRLCFP